MRAAVSAKPNKKKSGALCPASARFLYHRRYSLSRGLLLRGAPFPSGAEGSALQIQRKFVFAKFSKVDRSGSMRRSRSPPLRSSSISRSAETAEMFAYPGA